MEHIFIGVLNHSWNTSFLILAVLVVRLVVKKAPKWISCALWGLVALRLVLPVPVESVLSLVPGPEPIPENIIYSEAPNIDSGFSVINEAVNPVIQTNLAPEKNASADGTPMQTVIRLGTVVWVMGITVLLCYLLVTWMLLKKKVAAAERVDGNVYVSDEAVGPFLLGVLRPRVYIPSGIPEDVRECVLAHEKAHVERLDYLWKPLGYLILSIYWFHPLCWVSYILLCRDIELACDEKVTKDKDKEWKALYCQALLDCSLQRKLITACPLAFGEVSIKDRIKSVLHYKKPTFWLVLAALVISIAVAVCFMTNPKSSAESTAKEWDTTGTFENLPLAVNENGRLLSEKLADITIGEYEEESFFLNFAGHPFESEAYEEPEHGDDTPESWYSLGGVGICINPDYAGWEEFSDRKLTQYSYIDNHMSSEKKADVECGALNGCLYFYEMDLFTAPEIETLKPDVVMAGYWVFFLTEGEGQPLYTVFFDARYFTPEEAAACVSVSKLEYLPESSSEEGTDGEALDDEPDEVSDGGASDVSPGEGTDIPGEETSDIPYAQGRFDNVFGYAGYYQFFDTIGPYGYYYADDGSLLAYVWGAQPEDVGIVDLDVDGENELVSQVVWMADGGTDVVVYKKFHDGIRQAYCSDLMDREYDNHGVGSMMVEYLKNRNEVKISYNVDADGGGYREAVYDINYSLLNWREPDWIVSGEDSNEKETAIRKTSYWGDWRDLPCGYIAEVGLGNDNGLEFWISLQYYIHPEDTELIERFGLTEDDFPSGVDIRPIGETIGFPLSETCEYVLVDNEHMFDNDTRVKHDSSSGAVRTSDYSVFSEYMGGFTGNSLNQNRRLFFFDIRGGVIEAIYEPALP